ncbi:Dephospho-CoA kinase [Grifola frondosa]|uniref:Dephospho-CoA kinase n=1 Tax=Grifola frondosa TaxID=5627 RepID=A0A1C7LLT4_GRIFR|nr:Dephospho-CoA kinase [Grifola frondosa]
MAALSFIGKPISLISHSDVRYRGILAGIDPAASTIQLSNVYSMGTESRRPPDKFIPPVQEPYTYIIFRASEVKDLAVDDPTPRRNVHDDPAVLGASAPQMNTPYPPYGSPSYQPQAAAVVQQQSPAQVPAQQSRQQPYPARQPAAQPSVSQQSGSVPAQQAQAAPAATRSAAGSRNGRNSSVHTATASLETVERALGDLRVSNATANGAPVHQRGSGNAGGRRGRGQGQEIKAGDLRVPSTDFDFQSSNARFDKAALGVSPRGTPKSEVSEEEATGSSEAKEKAKEADGETAYNPKKSFFDSLSSGSNGPSADARGGRGGGRRGGGRNRREEERERNVATFGEPGGVGLMGPGAYVGGWGGYGRRGGVVGLTGGIATGKSTVSSLLRSHNLPVVDADLIAREVVQPGTPALAQIVKHFGEDVLLPDGTLDRPKLGTIVFNDEAKRRRLNAIVHPAVRREMFWSVLRHWWRGERICILDVPLLVEGGLWKFVGKVVVVYCSAEIELQRLMKRDNSSRAEAAARLNAQLPIAEKLQYADLVIDNSGTLQELESQVVLFVQKLYREAGWSWRISWLFPPWGLLSAVWTLGWRAVRRSQKASARRGSRVPDFE